MNSVHSPSAFSLGQEHLIVELVSHPLSRTALADTHINDQSSLSSFIDAGPKTPHIVAFINCERFVCIAGPLIALAIPMHRHDCHLLLIQAAKRLIRT